MAEQAISCPWQAPPAFLAARVVAEMLDSELRWGPHFAQLRLVSRGWREAADDALPALTPPPYLGVDEVAPLARRFRGLRLLRLQALCELTTYSALCCIAQATFEHLWLRYSAPRLLSDHSCLTHSTAAVPALPVQPLVR